MDRYIGRGAPRVKLGVLWPSAGSRSAWLGTVVLPDRFDLYDIGDNYVLGRWRDDLDVEHVQLYELVKPEQSPDSPEASL